MKLQEIAERCQQGDREAFALLYTATRQQLRSVCLRYVQNETVADDLLHDAFLLIFSKIKELKDTSRAEAWMKMVARRVALLYLRHQEKTASLSEAADMATPAASDTFTLAEILAAINALPQGYRRVFRLSVLEGMTHQQIAALLHIEPHSSSSQLFRAKVLLRRWLRPMLLLLLIAVLPVALRHWMQRQPLTHLSEREPVTMPSQTAKHDNPSIPVTHVIPATPVASITPTTPSATCTPTAPTIPGTPNAPVHLHTDEHTESAPSTADECTDTVPPRVITPCYPYTQQEQMGKTSNSNWTIDLACNGLSSLNDSRTMTLPYADAETNPMVSDSVGHHYLPFTVGLTVGYHIHRRWQLTTGLTYTRLTSDFSSGNTYVSLQQHQTVQYLGIPVSIAFCQPLSRRLQLSTSASVTLHLPLYSKQKSHYLLANGTMAEPATQRLHPGLQWSAGIGIGVQYELAPHVSFFVQPSLQHYFSNGSDVSTWNTAHPLVFAIPLGINVSF